MTTKARYRLRSILTWLVVILSAAISLAFIFSAQVFLEQGHNSWANLMTIAGSGVLALVNLYSILVLASNRTKIKVKRDALHVYPEQHVIESSFKLSTL